MKSGPAVRLNYRPRVYLQGRARVFLSCLKHTEVRATPEEIVREKVLHWLLMKRRVEQSRVRVEEGVRFTSGKRGRADIVVFDARKQPSVIIECKRPGGAGYDAEQQAIRYARKLGARHIWITDGAEHRALVRRPDGTWRQALGLPFAARVPTTSVLELPSLRCSATATKRYVRFHLSRPVTDRNLHRFALAIYRVIFANARFATRLPYSWRGLHILEDRGYSKLSIKTPGGSWAGFYRVLRVATEGRVETAALGVDAWKGGGLRLFLAFFDPSHHALQLDASKYCNFNADGSFEVYHDGRFGGRAKKREFILEALREAGRDDLLEGDGRRAIHLGRLPAPNEITWLRTRKFLANLLHYGMIRHSIRKAHKYARPKTLKRSA